MPVEQLAPSRPAQQEAPSAGWVEINPRFREQLAGRGLTAAGVLLDLPGEVVSGHPDRHVRRVELPGWGALYLKRQHRVTWRERLRQRLAGFGWVSRCGREARLLRELEAEGFPCPVWVAHGEDGHGRAFLLVEELRGVIELRRLLGDTRLSPADRRRLAERLGQQVAELHATGFTTPDLTAKHVFVDPDSFAVTLIDWQSARRVERLGERDSSTALAALDASLAEHLATPAERGRFLWAYRRAMSFGPRASRPLLARCGRDARGPKDIARTVALLSAHQRTRRSVRDQRQPVVTAAEQRLVWVAGEAVCAVPDVAGVWPTPAIAAPFYDATRPATTPIRVRLTDGRAAELTRGRSFAPIGRLRAWLRGRPWRSPGATLGRVLFHLQRYGVPGPQLYAFGQRETNPASADWFALYEPPAGRPLADWLRTTPPPSLRREVFAQVGLVLRQLHDAGCRYTGTGPLVRVADDPAGRVSIGDVRTVRIAKRVSARDRRADLLALVRQLPGGTRTDRLRVVCGYFGAKWAGDPHQRTTGRRAISAPGRGRA